MYKKWFLYKEIPVGTRRLFISYLLYKLFGSFPLRLISFFVSTSAFLSCKEQRDNCIRFFKTLENYTGKKYHPLLSAYRQFLNYGISLGDKIISFSGNYTARDFEFCENSKEEICKYLRERKGIFFLTTHIGNAEILRSLTTFLPGPLPDKINVFLEKRSCEIFNNFLNTIEVDMKIETYAVEDTNAGTAIELSEKLRRGDFVFMAGDRISADNPEKFYRAKLLDKNIKLPKGAVKLAQILEVPIFFTVCVKCAGQYRIYAEEFRTDKTKKSEIFEDLKGQYSKFLEKYTIKFPHAFFNFYNIFED